MVLDRRRSQHTFLVDTFDPRFLGSFTLQRFPSSSQVALLVSPPGSFLSPCAPLGPSRVNEALLPGLTLPMHPPAKPGSLLTTKEHSPALLGLCSCSAPLNGNNFSTYSKSTRPKGLPQVLPLLWNYQATVSTLLKAYSTYCLDHTVWPL